MVRVALAVSIALAVAASPLVAQDPPGKGTYLKYCSACHGPGGKGDGVVSQNLNPKPIDLTQLAKKAGGEFPTLKVIKAIDGRETPRAHGDSAMPVWGELFKSETGGSINPDAAVQGKVMEITSYLRAIQTK